MAFYTQREGGSGGGGGGTVVPNLSMNPPTIGVVNGSNQVFTYDGQVSLVVVDSKIDVDAVISFSNGVSTITTSVPPQENMAVITGNYLIQQVPSDTINSVNRVYHFTGQAILAIVDGSPDQDAVFSFDQSTGITTVTTSTPPQNNVLLVGGGGMNPQVPDGLVNSVNTIFVAIGIVTIPVDDSSIDVDAVLVYNTGTNMTTIVYSTPPQNNVYVF